MVAASSGNAGKPGGGRLRIAALAVGALAVLVALALWLDDGPRPIEADPTAQATSDVDDDPLPMATDNAQESPLVVPQGEAPPPVDDVLVQHPLELEALQQLMQAPSEARELKVIVMDAAGAPLADARVETWSSLRALDAGNGPQDVVWTDGTGSAPITLGGRSALAFAVRDTGEGSDVSAVRPGRSLEREAQRSGRAVLTVHPRATLDGQVLQADDRPAVGARVTFERSALGASTVRVPEPVVTDADGAFSCAVDAFAELQAVATFDTLESHPVDAATRPEGRHAVEIRLPGRWTVSGQLLDHEGEPATAGEVSLWLQFPGLDIEAGQRPDDRGHREQVVTDTDGAFEFALPRQGSYTLLGTRDDSAPSEAVTLHVDDGLPHGRAVLRLIEAGRIAGRVVDGAGTGLPGLKVHARPAHLYDETAQQFAPTVWLRHGEAESDTDEAGRFDLGPLHPDGRYVVFVRPVEGRRDLKLVHKGVAPGIDDLLLVASEENLKRAHIDGLVLSDGSGNTLTDFWPRLVIRLDGRVIDTEESPVRSPDGTFHIEGLAPGYEYRLRVEAPEHGAAEVDWFVADRRGHDFTLRLPPNGDVDVEVVDHRGAPLPLAEVRARRPGGDFGDESRDLGRTDDLGRATVSLPPGAWQLTARRGELQVEVTADVRPAQRRDVRIELR